MRNADTTIPTTLRALNMAAGLMQGDPASFKAGYTLDNAHLAVVEYFKLDEDEAASVLRMLKQREGVA